MRTDGTTREIELRLFGGFGLSIAGDALDITPAAQRLLAFVALSPRGAERSYTAFQLWPDHDETRAKANLRSALWRLGKAPVDLVVATKNHLRLAPEIWVDVRDGIERPTVDSADGCTPLPFEAIDYDLLPDWYDDWITIERERLRQFRLASLEAASRSALLQGRTSQAVQLALAAIAIDSARESAHRLVTEAHLAAGNLADAIRQFDLFSTIVRTRLGCGPSELYMALIDDAVPCRRAFLVAV